eukprot:875817-Rhodomonas_salina.1
MQKDHGRVMLAAAGFNRHRGIQWASSRGAIHLEGAETGNSAGERRRKTASGGSDEGTDGAGDEQGEQPPESAHTS